MKTAVFMLACLVACSDDESPGKLADAPIVIDAAIDAAPTCPPLTGAGTTHTGGSVSTAQTWTAAESPHRLPIDFSINAALTIEACAVVQIADYRSITVRGGSLTAAGKPGQPVTFERLDPNGSWGYIAGGSMSFTYTEMKGGGDPLTSLPVIAGMLDVSGPTATPTANVHADHLTITGSESNGINFSGGGGFDATSTAVTVTGSALAPIITHARVVGLIPPGTYTGNGEDAIVIRATGGNEAIGENTTMRARGVPYRVGINPNAVLDVGNLTAPPTLTIEPGVTLKFLPSATMRIDGSNGTTPAVGALIAVGTAAQPIVFTSAAATPAPGDWYGIWLGRQPLAATKLDHIRVEFAGRASVSSTESCVPAGQTGFNDAAIRILGGEPTSAFITNTTIVSSARHGIDRGFRSDTKPSLLATNTFTNVPGCRETYPRDISGGCPTPVPCP